ncbi:MAG: GNAT family N-acetyltransferase [Aliishimia sp.]
MTPRRVAPEDAVELLGLYRALVGDAPVGEEDAVLAVLAHPGSEIWCLEDNGALVSMVTLHVLPNVTQGARPYALIENVVTLEAHQGKGFGRAVMIAAMNAAWAQDAYKIMLLTGKTAQARGFYEKLGFGADEKWGMSIRRAPTRAIY